MWPFATKADKSETLAPSESTPLKPPPPETPPPTGHTSMLGAAAILATFSTTSSNVMYPRAYGVLGSVLGPILGLAIQGFMCALAALTLRIAVKLDCRTFSELGRALGGVWGGRILGGVQQLNNALFMPVALVYSSNALRHFILVLLRCHGDDEESQIDPTCAWWACNINSLWVVCLVAWPVLLLARDVGELSWNSYLSLILILVQTGAMVENASTTYPNGNASLVGPPLHFFGSPLETTWYTTIAAVGTYLYSFCPLFIAVEVAASMENPSQILHALLISFLFNVAIYIPTGLLIGSHWGAGMPTPITERLTNAPAAISNAILFYCTFLDFAIVGAVLNRELQAVWMPTFDRLCTPKNLPTWLLLTLPSLLFALALSILTPRLDSLSGFLESLCIPLTMLAGVPAMLLLLRMRRESLLKSETPASKQVTALEMARGWEGALIGGVILGIGLMLAVFAETVHSIISLDYGGGRFFCDLVAR